MKHSRTARRYASVAVAALCLALAAWCCHAQSIQPKDPTMPRKPQADADDKSTVSVLLDRYRKRYLAYPKPAAARKLAGAMRPDGTWADIDYKNERLMSWDPRRHLSNLSTMAVALVAPGSKVAGDPALRKAVYAALDHWLAKDYRSPNWWWNEIGVPMNLLPTLFALWEDLSPEQRNRSLAILARARVRMTGQNLVWLAELALQRGLLEGNVKRVEQCAERIAGEIVITAKEGLQPDFSFHQHGPCLYSLGYGRGFLNDLSRLAATLHGTAAALPKEKVDLLVRMALDGTQWMGRFEGPEHGARGREIARAGGSRAFLKDVAANLLKLDPPRADELKAMAARAGGDESTPLVGNRMFWRSDLMTHHRRGWYACSRGYGRDLVNTDSPHGQEAIYNHYIADGAMFVMRRGDEYDNIWPVYDWRKIPGTTVVQSAKPDGDVRREGNTAFAGGASDGSVGCMSFELDRSGLTVRKGWFFFDDKVVCLGAGLTSTAAEPVATTLDQRHLNGPVYVRRGKTWQKVEADRPVEGPAWLWHDEVAWHIDAGAAVQVAAGKRTGSWYDINRQRSKTPVTCEVFSAWIDHGARPKDATYAYVMVPCAGRKQLPDPTDGPPVKVLANSVKLQAVHDKASGVTQAIFYEPGTLAVNPELTLTVDRPCAIVCRPEKTGAAIAAADPRDRAGRLTLTVRGGKPIDDAERTPEGWRMVFELPGGMEAGRSVMKQ